MSSVYLIPEGLVLRCREVGRYSSSSSFRGDGRVFPKTFWGDFLFNGNRTSLDLRWNRMEREELDGSSFVSGGRGYREGGQEC